MFLLIYKYEKPRLSEWKYWRYWENTQNNQSLKVKK